MAFSGQGIGATVNRYTIIYKGDAKAINSNNTDHIGGYTQSNTAVSSVTDAIKTPNTYYYFNVPNWSWYKFGDISLWSDYGTNKSIYDPCPYGYRVPINGSWDSWITIAKYSVDIDGGAIWSNTWWPAAGRRNVDSGTITLIGNRGCYWSSTRHSYAYYSYNLYFDYNIGVNPSSYAERSYGFTVRCVQERGRGSLALGRASGGGGAGGGE